MHVDGYCPGCGGGEGNQSCKIAKCSLVHEKVEYCSQCSEFPCEKYEGIDEYDSVIVEAKKNLYDEILKIYNEAYKRYLKKMQK